MDTREGWPRNRRRVALVAAAAIALVVVGILGVNKYLDLASRNKACIGGGVISDPGADTEEMARTQWGAELRGVDIERPDRTSGSADRVTSIYLLPTPEADWGDPDHTYFYEVQTERGDDGLWRVVGAPKCEEWSSR